MSLPDAIRTWLQWHGGLDLETLGDLLPKKALARRLQDTRCRDEADYLRLWNAEDLEKERLLQALLVGETWFFREWPAFEVMSDFIEAGRAQWRAETPLKILSLPASTGEEPWSIAAVCLRLGLGPDDVHIDALDINAKALEVARRGLYPEIRFRQRSPEDWPWAFEAQVLKGERVWRIREALHALVSFRIENALSPDFLDGEGHYHLIFLRNLLIYLNPEARRRLLQALGRRLAPEGLIFLGHSEVFPPDLGFKRMGRVGGFAWTRAERLPSALAKNAKTRPRVGLSRPSIGPGFKAYAVASTLPSAAAHRGPQSPDPFPKRGLDLDASLDQARRLADEGDYQAALALLDQPQCLGAPDPEVHCLAGILSSALGMSQDAMRRFRRALYLDPHHAESLFHLALILEGRGDAQAAGRLRARMPVVTETLP